MVIKCNYCEASRFKTVKMHGTTFKKCTGCKALYENKAVVKKEKQIQEERDNRSS